MSYCDSSYEGREHEILSPFEKNICLNKKGILGGIGFMFIVAIISGMINKKMKKKSNMNAAQNTSIN